LVEGVGYGKRDHLVLHLLHLLVCGPSCSVSFRFSVYLRVEFSIFCQE